MISLTLGVALIPYLVILAIFAFLATYCVFSMVRHGATTGASFIATFAFLAGASFVLFFTWESLQGVDWQQRIDLNPRVQPSSLSTQPL